MGRFVIIDAIFGLGKPIHIKFYKNRPITDQKKIYQSIIRRRETLLNHQRYQPMTTRPTIISSLIYATFLGVVGISSFAGAMLLSTKASQVPDSPSEFTTPNLAPLDQFHPPGCEATLLPGISAAISQRDIKTDLAIEAFPIDTPIDNQIHDLKPDRELMIGINGIDASHPPVSPAHADTHNLPQPPAASTETNRQASLRVNASAGGATGSGGHVAQGNSSNGGGGASAAGSSPEQTAPAPAQESLSVIDLDEAVLVTNQAVELLATESLDIDAASPNDTALISPSDQPNHFFDLQQPAIYTHHASLHRVYPKTFRPLVVLVNGDFDHERDSPPPSLETIDAAFQPGRRAYRKIQDAIANNGVIIDDSEWMPSYYPNANIPAFRVAIDAKLHIIAHIRRLAPQQPIAVFGPICDARLWTGLQGHAEGDRYWTRKYQSELVLRKANWDQAWAECLQRLLPAYDAIAMITYPKIRHADYYPLEPDRWWELEDWLPQHIEQMRMADLPLIPYVWHRYSSQHLDPNIGVHYPLADIEYVDRLIRILHAEGLKQAFLWMAWDEVVNHETHQRIDLFLNAFMSERNP